jgi:aspartate carbamoyltransferase regulatory subunit
MKEELKITPINNGTVIDHITAGKVWDVIKILKIDENTKDEVRLASNVQSKKMGKKDLLMIEGRELSREETNRITLVAPNATINIIRDSKVVKKEKVKLPEMIEGIIKCSNQTCISNKQGEPVSSRLKVIKQENRRVVLRCFYCNRITRV